ncbi:hypothetical protein HMPREF1326_01520 [Akkermansia sp. KLE1605]|nr:hypothetical protein HMPREF1326_01520 [Akkermansia sp. KLE1605]
MTGGLTDRERNSPTFTGPFCQAAIIFRKGFEMGLVLPYGECAAWILP